MLIINRRKFIRTSALATSSLMLPEFLWASEKRKPEAGLKTLVIVQLSGGNDGLNTVIPYRNDIYYKARPKLGIKQQHALPLTDELGIHPALKGLKSLYDNGALSVLNQVGYPDPDRTHFRATKIWQTASSFRKGFSTGWIGRYLDAQSDSCGQTSQALEINDTLSLTLKGEKKRGIAVTDPRQLYPISHDKKSKLYPSTAHYPHSKFGKGLKTIAELIISGCDTRIYSISLGSFDTHVDQLPQQQRLFTQLGDGLKIFADDLKKHNHFEDVMIMTFSEFGRRVAQNASGGTDHGAANCMFLISGGIKKQGVLNAAPDFSHLDQKNPEFGDLIYKVDFRDVYATLLHKWLKANDKALLGENYQYLDFI